MPPGQGVGEVEPAVGQYEATGHASQRVALCSGWYVPTEHRAHVGMLWRRAYVPGLHMAGSVAPVLHAEPTGQATHCSAEARLGASLYVPASHGRGAALPAVQ